MSSDNLFDLFRAHFPDDADAVCLEVAGDRSRSWAALDAETARLQALLARLGVAAGDRVVAQVEKSPEAVLLYLACLRRGAVYVPLNTAYTRDEVGYVLADAEPHLLVCDPGRETELAAPARHAGVAHLQSLDAGGGGTLAAYREEPRDEAVTPRDAGDLAALLYTSGTTGRPKGAMLSHGNLAANARTLVEIWRWRPDDVLLHALPLFHAHGLFVALHCALLGGSRLLLLPKFDAARVVTLLRQTTVYMGVPTHYTRLIEVPALDAETCRGMRLFVSGSAPLLARTHRDFEARTGHRILERYGMTEALMIASNPYDGARVPGSVGFPLPGVEARVIDSEGRSAAPGAPGELEIRGPSIFSGYWRLAEKTRDEFRGDGWFRTGDIAAIAADGRITLVGRQKDLVISGGLNVYPAEVEAAVDAVEGVRESAVIGVPHPDLGEGVTAVVVRDGSRELSEETLRAALGAGLARFKHPKRVFFVDALPRNTMGKVQKSALRERFANAYST
jgi:malonyl-CoA/methylmalonyl-CoA synthetase